MAPVQFRVRILVLFTLQFLGVGTDLILHFNCSFFHPSITLRGSRGGGGSLVLQQAATKNKFTNEE